MEKTYLYKSYRGGVYLGLLPKVSSEFQIAQDINSGAVELNIVCAVSADRRSEATEAILDETTDPILDEAGQQILEERRPDWVSDYNNGAIIANGNTVKVYEVSDDNPNGKLVFNGWMSTNTAVYGDNDVIEIKCLSNGTELGNYLILGQETLDQSQATADTYNSIIDAGNPSTEIVGQTFKTGATVTSLHSIALKLYSFTGASLSATLKLWNLPSDATGDYDHLTATPLGSVTRTISGTTPTEYVLTFPDSITVSANTSYFWTLEAEDFFDGSKQIRVGLSSTDTYANGSGYLYQGAWNTWLTLFGADQDFYFKTYYTAGATSSPYTSSDPTTILKSIIDNYTARGGLINYSASSTDLTSTSLSYTFKVNTVLEGIKKLHELAPYDWYWWVDPANDIIYFKQTATTATHKFVLGKHISSLRLTRTIDSVVNLVYFSGGDDGTGSNIFYKYINNDSIDALGRQFMSRLSDGRVTTAATASVLGNNELDLNASEVYQAPLTISAADYDISTIHVGDTVSFEGAGIPIDNYILQVARTIYHPDYIEIMLGRIPPRQSSLTAQTLSDLTAIQTLDNPSAPS